VSSEPLQVTVNVEFAVGGERFRGEVPVPAGPARADDLLPVFQQLTDTIVGIAADHSTRAGKPVSCRKGCGACCRQLVPISEPEARALHRLVSELPEPRRSEIRARFAEAARRLEAAGLVEQLRDPERCLDQNLRAFGLAYFRQAIACPFLEEESCSIHPDRPLSCREYLVTSPAEHCASPSAETVRPVDLPTKVSTILTRLDADPKARFARWVPMILALEWAEAHPEEEPPRRTGPELLREVFERLAGRAPDRPAV
jgi:Fe-S-cluster containining protein